jgi:hypothetical protein
MSEFAFLLGTSQESIPPDGTPNNRETRWIDLRRRA